jgi:Ca2+-binding EF-hand superfamily protein
VIKDQRIDITPTESNSIFDLFDNEGVGLVSYAEFMFTLRGHIPEVRKELAGKLWNQIKSNDDTTSFSKIRHLLNFRSHPDVQTGRRY